MHLGKRRQRGMEVGQAIFLPSLLFSYWNFVLRIPLHSLSKFPYIINMPCSFSWGTVCLRVVRSRIAHHRIWRPTQKAHNELLFGCSTTAVSMNHPWGLELKWELYSLPLSVTISEFSDLVQIYHCMKLQTEQSDIDTCGLERKKRMLRATESKVSAFSPDC